MLRATSSAALPFFPVHFRESWRAADFKQFAALKAGTFGLVPELFVTEKWRLVTFGG